LTGLGLSIAGIDPTGWESLNLPVLDCSIPQWDGPNGPVIVSRCSNRKQALGSGEFLHPERSGPTNLGAEFNPFAQFVPGSSYQLGNTGGHVGGDATMTHADGGLSALLGNTPSWGDTSDIPTDPGSYLQSIGAPPGEMEGAGGFNPFDVGGGSMPAASAGPAPTPPAAHEAAPEAPDDEADA